MPTLEPFRRDWRRVNNLMETGQKLGIPPEAAGGLGETIILNTGERRQINTGLAASGGWNIGNTDSHIASQFVRNVSGEIQIEMTAITPGNSWVYAYRGGQTDREVESYHIIVLGQVATSIIHPPPNNIEPTGGIWANDTYYWIAVNDSTLLKAYSIADGDPAPNRDIATSGGQYITSDGETMWVSTSDNNDILAWDLATGARKTTHDITLQNLFARRSRNSSYSDGNIQGLFFDSTSRYLYVVLNLLGFRQEIEGSYLRRLLIPFDFPAESIIEDKYLGRLNYPFTDKGLVINNNTVWFSGFAESFFKGFITGERLDAYVFPGGEPPNLPTSGYSNLPSSWIERATSEDITLPESFGHTPDDLGEVQGIKDMHLRPDASIWAIVYRRPAINTNGVGRIEVISNPFGVPQPINTRPLLNRDFIFTPHELVSGQTVTHDVSNAWSYDGTGDLTYAVAADRNELILSAEIATPATPTVTLNTRLRDGLGVSEIEAIATNASGVEFTSDENLALYGWTISSEVLLPWHGSGLTITGSVCWVKRAGTSQIYRINADGTPSTIINHPNLTPTATIITGYIGRNTTEDILFFVEQTEIIALKTRSGNRVEAGRHNIGHQITGLAYNQTNKVLHITSGRTPNAIESHPINPFAANVFEVSDFTPTRTFPTRHPGKISIGDFEKFVINSNTVDNPASVLTHQIVGLPLEEEAGVTNQLTETSVTNPILDIAYDLVNEKVIVLRDNQTMITLDPRTEMPYPDGVYSTGYAPVVTVGVGRNQTVNASQMFFPEGLTGDRIARYSLSYLGGDTDIRIIPASIDRTATNNNPASFAVAASPRARRRTLEEGLQVSCFMLDPASDVRIGLTRTFNLKLVVS